MSRQYEQGIDLGKHRDGILEPVEIKGQDTTFGLGFKPTRKDYQTMTFGLGFKPKERKKTN